MCRLIPKMVQIFIICQRQYFALLNKYLRTQQLLEVTGLQGNLCAFSTDDKELAHIGRL